MTTLTFSDFFCGVGGIRLGLEHAGRDGEQKMECVFSNDIDKNTIVTYQTNFPEKVCNISISDLDPREIPDFDLLLAGFPCQSFSIAGEKKGLEDVRGNLFFSLVHVLQAKKPKVFLLENVKNLKTHDKGKTFQTVMQALEEIGYFVQTRVMNSADYSNLPQNRERLFFVGFLDKDKYDRFEFPSKADLTRDVSDFLEKSVPDKYYYTEKSAIYPALAESVVDPVRENQVYQYRRHYVRENKSGLCPTLTANMGGGGHNVPIILDDRGIRKLTPRECFSLQNFPVQYRLPKIADTHLYKQAGNTVDVGLIQKICGKILEVL